MGANEHGRILGYIGSLLNEAEAALQEAIDYPLIVNERTQHDRFWSFGFALRACMKHGLGLIQGQPDARTKAC